MKLVFLPHSARIPKRGYRLIPAALALLVVVSLTGVFFSHASVADAGGCGDFFIVNQQTGYYLDVAGETPIHGAPIDQWYNDGSLSENWTLIQVPGYGADYIQNLNGGKYLDVAGASTANGASVIQWYFNGNANQQWFLDGVGNGVYYIQNVNSDLVLDVATSRLGAQVIQDSYKGWLSQEWSLQVGNAGC